MENGASVRWAGVHPWNLDVLPWRHTSDKLVFPQSGKSIDKEGVPPTLADTSKKPGRGAIQGT